MSNTKLISLFDNTRLSSFKTCARHYYLRHVRAWVPDSKKVALTFGSSWHAAMDVVWARYAELYKDRKSDAAIVDAAYAAFVAEWTSNALPHPDELSPDELDDFSPRTPQIAREMLYGYIAARRHIFTDPSFKLLAIELPFAVPLSPDDDTTWYVGRLDKVFEYRGQILGGEHKTTSLYKRDGHFRSDFLDQFNPNSQIDGYCYALRMLHGERAAGVWIDGALVHKTEHDGFVFIPESRTHDQLDGFLWTAWAYIDAIRGNKLAMIERRGSNAPYMPAFPMNTASCGNWGGCEYRSICQVVADPQKWDAPPLGFSVSHWSPFSELKLEKLGFTPDSAQESPA